MENDDDSPILFWRTNLLVNTVFDLNSNNKRIWFNCVYVVVDILIGWKIFIDLFVLVFVILTSSVTNDKDKRIYSKRSL